VDVQSFEEVMTVFAQGSACRATAATNMNEHSSRSHLLLQVEVTTTSLDEMPVKAKLYLVDLAGWTACAFWCLFVRGVLFVMLYRLGEVIEEWGSRCRDEGGTVHQQEFECFRRRHGSIGSEEQAYSLQASAVVDVVVIGEARGHFKESYRNSKLTYLLQDSLGGNSRTMMIVTLCPTEDSSDETLFALQFASRVRNITFSAVGGGSLPVLLAIV
jgi:kinesin family protein C2/C3